MKKTILLLMLATVALACKNSEEKNKESEETATENIENLKTYKGDFIESDGAMVFMGKSFIYGVKSNEISEELSKQVAAVKKNDFDMVNVVVRGTVAENTDEVSEWEEVITILEIIRVSDKPSEADIEFEEKENQK